MPKSTQPISLMAFQKIIKQSKRRKLFNRFISSLLLILGLIPTQSYAQPGYNFSSSSGTYSGITGGTLHSSGSGMDDATFSVTLPFSFNFNGTAYTQIFLSENGYISFGATNPGTTTRSAISSANAGFEVAAALAGDLQGTTTGEMRSEVIGTAPNRIFVAQWSNLQQYLGSGQSYNFQIRLEEANGVAANQLVRYMYGTVSSTSATNTYQVGLRGTTSSSFRNRTTTSNWASTTAGTTNADACTVSPTVAPASGLTFTWTPLPMSFSSTTTTQTLTTPVSQGSTNQQIIGIQVVTTGGNVSPLTLTSLALNTTGTTSVADIVNAKVFYTGTSSTFATATQFGTTVTSPSGTFSVSGSQTLALGTNFFWVTYDVSPTAISLNLLDAQCTQITVSSVNYTPTITNPAGTRQIVVPLSGSYNVGAGGNFPTLTSAANTITAAGVNGPVTFNLTDANYSTNETFPITFGVISGASSINTLTIRPAAGVTPTITGNASALLQFNGTDFVTLNGSNSNSNTIDLSIINNSTSASAAIAFGSLGTGAGSTNNTVRNCNIWGGSSTATGVIGISVAGTTVSTSGTGADNDNFTITNNLIDRAYFGIYVRGVASTGMNDNLVISNNIIGDPVPANTVTFAGIDVQNASNPLVQGNNISNMAQTAGISTSPSAIAIGGSITNGTVTGNIINGVRNPSSGGWGAYGINVTGTITTLNITNNDISDISTMNYSTSSTTFNAFGIRITVGGTYNIYNNSVNLFGPVPNVGSTAHFSSAILLTGGTSVDLRNNVLVNSQTGLTGAKSYAIYSTIANTVYTSTTNRNCYFVSGSNGILGFIGAADQTTLTAWQTAIAGSKDVNSISSNPNFNANNNLRPVTGSPLLNSGGNIVSITTDLRGVARSASTPTIGAYEIAGEFIAPALSFTPLNNTVFTTNRTTTNFATITDASGVNATSGTRPRLYFKKSTNANAFVGNTSADNGWKWVEANNTTSPFDFTINYSLLTGGSVMPGEIIQYFVVAQDLASIPNITWSTGSSSPFGFNTSPTSVAISAGNFPVWGAVASYTIAQQLSGVYLVGAGQQFTSLTNAGGFFEYVNNNAVAGDIVALITSNLTENGTFALNQTTEVNGSNFTISIQPSAQSVRTISGSFSGGLLRLSGADRVIFDGRFNQTGNGNFLSFNNSSPSGNTAAIQLISLGNGLGCNRTVIRNCTFTLPRTGPTSVAISSGGAVGNTGSDNDTLTILNNVIRSARFGIYVGGNATPNTTDMVVVENNIVGTDTLSFSAALLANINGITVKNNSFMNALSTTANNYVVQLSNVQNGHVEGNIIENGQSTAGNVFGLILSGNDSNLTVSRNTVRNINYTGSGGYGGRGIDVNTTVPNSNISITNNIVNNIFGDGDQDIEAFGISGIMVRGTTGNVRVQQNTVRLGGVISIGTYTSRSTAFYLGSSVSNIDVRNNIFANSIVKTNVTASETFAIINNATTNANLSAIAYNNYAATGVQARIGYSAAANRVSINDWKSNVTADATSQSRVVNFVDTTASNLRLAVSSNGDFYLRSLNLGNSLTNADFDNVTRRPISYMGAFEASTPLTMSANAGADTAVCVGSSVQIGGTSIVTGGVAPYTYAWSPTATAVSNPTVSPTINTTYIVTVTDTFGFTARDTVFVTVNLAPNPPSASGPSTLCAGNTANLTATGTGTFEWFKNATGGTALGTGNSYTTAVLNANDSFYVSVTNVQGCTSARTKVNVNVTSPVAPTATNATICSGNTASLTATGIGTLNWFKNATGGTSLASGANYTTGVLNANDSFYVQSTLNGCISTRTQVNVTVNATPVAPSVLTPAAICEGNSTQLIASPSAGTTQWFTSATGGTALASGDTLSTGSLSANATYYAGKTANGCLSSTRTLVSVTVNAIPALPSVAGATLCNGDSVTLTATGFATGDSVMWFDAATGGTKLADGSSYSTGALSASATYYVGIKSAAGCSNSSRRSAAVTVNPIPAAPQLADATICEGTSANFDFSTINGSLRWYNDASTITPSFSGNVFNTGVLADNDTFFVSVIQSGCESQRTQVAALVTKLAAVPSASNTKVCEGLPATLTANSGSADIYWYSTLTGGSPVDSGSTITVNGITATTIYYAESRNGACITAERKPVVVVFYNKPDAAFTVQTQFMGGITFAPATPNGLAYNWNFGDGNSSTVVNPTHKYNANGNYNVKLVVVNPTSGCSDSTTQSVNVLSVGFADKQANGFQADVYPNPFRETAQITYTLTSAQDVSIRVVNLLGQEVMQLPAGLKQAGTHQVDFNSANLASGVYYVRLQVGATQHTLRVVKAN